MVSNLNFDYDFIGHQSNMQKELDFLILSSDPDIGVHELNTLKI